MDSVFKLSYRTAWNKRTKDGSLHFMENIKRCDMIYEVLGKMSVYSSIGFEITILQRINSFFVYRFLYFQFFVCVYFSNKGIFMDLYHNSF